MCVQGGLVPLGPLNLCPLWIVLSPSLVDWYTTESDHTTVVPYSKPPLEVLSGLVFREFLTSEDNNVICIPQCVTDILIESYEVIHNQAPCPPPPLWRIAHGHRCPPDFLLKAWLWFLCLLAWNQSNDIVFPSPCCLAVFVMMSSQVLSRAPSVSRKAPNENFPVFHCFLYNLYIWSNPVGVTLKCTVKFSITYISLLLYAWYSMVSVDFCLVVKDYM